jgi:hypothetical protein
MSLQGAQRRFPVTGFTLPHRSQSPAAMRLAKHCFIQLFW